ncbi:maleylacetoacetate isomerase [Aliidiomarina haloalkalitolerans]|uniref:Maleylacetoacetate isomerase n=1 Tax=Aliidiomarina haloalkalitolerans TaxID=859059 RepID=A0A432VY30_9GAMM|nr:maleylacetoacetate isomerase [Aliidiomarina haloalkalitolerans]RUO21584.1 maleylacetoacetate isomerase [Aliidiomarina haloalkalitolerans]
MKPKLHGYWRSSASYRVRIALALKGIEYDYVPVHLLRDGGEQKSARYQQLNPAQLVPTLEIANTANGETLCLNQSLAIIEYLDAIYPAVRLIPADPAQAAVVRMLALDMAADLQPVTNLRVLQALTTDFALPETAKGEWIKLWVTRTFAAFEQRLQRYAGHYCYGDHVTLADVCLVPQVYNAKRFGVDLTPYPNLQRVIANLEALPALQMAAPEAQVDANS